LSFILAPQPLRARKAGNQINILEFAYAGWFYGRVACRLFRTGAWTMSRGEKDWLDARAEEAKIRLRAGLDRSRAAVAQYRARLSALRAAERLMRQGMAERGAAGLRP
jgi:hypothetical protein